MRRGWVWGWVLIFAGSFAGCSPGGASRAALVGAWRSSVRFDSGAFAPIQDLEFMYVFHDDGTLTESSNYDAAPPVPPAYGVWRTIRPNEFEARYEFYATSPSAPDAFKSGAGWIPSGRGVLTERIRLSDDGGSFTSTIQYQALDRAGKPAEGGGIAKGRGTKMRF
ncbi:MAG TPA: hypothetical protein VL503_00355 [Candidatus Omnitrophota bacterium]|jgi:hypothetical protein|nr:hypothetical protein [Candidatus Omnitrophota bacterium]